MAESSLPNHQRYNELRKKYREELLRSVDPTEILFSALSTIESFKDKVSKMRSIKTRKETAYKILSLPLDQNYNCTIGPFMSVLRENSHAHVASVFTKASTEELLSDANFKLLRKKLVDLCTYLDPDCGIIETLISADVFDDSDKERVLAYETTHEKSGEIVEILSHRSNISYQSFIRVLQEMHQEHILYILNEVGSPPISKDDITLINKQREDIVKHMESLYTPFVDALVSLGVFTDVDRQRVVAKGAIRFERNQQIVNILLRKSKRRFDMFLVALKNSGQEHLISLFVGIRINATLHVNLSDHSRADLNDVETVLREALERDFEDEESDIRNEMEHLEVCDVGVEVGSIRIWFKFVKRETLEVMRTDKLDRLFTERYCKKFSDKGLQSIHAEIPETEFKRCELICMKRKALMEPEHQQALQCAKARVADQIVVDESLLKKLSLSKCRQDSILNQSSGEDKAKVLLDVMACRPDCEFQILLNALRDTQQDEAANCIMKAVRRATRSADTKTGRTAADQQVEKRAGTV